MGDIPEQLSLTREIRGELKAVRETVSELKTREESGRVSMTHLGDTVRAAVEGLSELRSLVAANSQAVTRLTALVESLSNKAASFEDAFVKVPILHSDLKRLSEDFKRLYDLHETCPSRVARVEGDLAKVSVVVDGLQRRILTWGGGLAVILVLGSLVKDQIHFGGRPREKPAPAPISDPVKP
tara:strand:- start:3710 stop:4258 length:549 start_codon:yes stop_codon:yes gene_type:complete